MSRILAVAATLVLAAPSAASAKEAPPAIRRLNVECPTPKECKRLERERLACESKKTCDSFLATMTRLLAKYDCQRPVDSGYENAVPAIWLCQEVKTQAMVRDGWGDALATLSKLTSRAALGLFSSAALREALTGEYAEVYRNLSDRAERRLVVGEDTEAGGAGPDLEGGNFPGMKARASSTARAVEGQTFDAGMAVDGKTFTAWCAGPGTGTVAWLEASLRRPEWYAGRSFCGFTFIPGYARTQATYRAHKRPSRVRIASCSRPDSSFEIDLKTSAPEDFNQALVFVRVPEGALGGEGECVRITVLGATEGGDEPPCISEVAPEYNCGK